MKLWIFPLTVVDCTADPHPVSFDGLEDALEAIRRVCESGLVQAIRSVTLTLDTDDGEVTYETDWYSTWARDRQPVNHPEARAGKYAGLYYQSEAEVPPERHLPPGLLGLKEAIRLILENPECLVRLSVGVVWSFAGDASCSDYIILPAEGCEGEPVVDFSNQDWWVGKPGYREHCRRLGEILGVEIEPTPLEE